MESLAKPASILTDFAAIGTVPSHSAKSSVDNCLGLMSSLRRILKRSLGYSGISGSSDTEEVEDAPLLLKGLVAPSVSDGLGDEELVGPGASFCKEGPGVEINC